MCEFNKINANSLFLDISYIDEQGIRHDPAMAAMTAPTNVHKL